MTGALLLAFAAFVALGLPDTVLGVAWPSLHGLLGVGHGALGAAVLASTGAYFASNLAAARLVGLLGTGGLLAASEALVVGGLCGIAGASVVGGPIGFALFVVASAVVGLGSGAVDAALNAYAARAFRAAHVAWLHAAWAVGASIGPLVMTTAIARGAGPFGGYVALAGALAVVVGVFVVVRRRLDGDATTSGAATAPSLRDALRSSAVRWQAAAFCAYAGVEAGAGQWAATTLIEARGFTATSAGLWTSAYWSALLAGRVANGFVVERVGPTRLARAAAILALVGTAVFAFAPSTTGAIGLVGLGFVLAPIYPSLMSASPARHGALSAHAVGASVAGATLGMATIPGAIGLLVDAGGARWAPVAVFGVAAAMAAAVAASTRRGAT